MKNKTEFKDLTAWLRVAIIGGWIALGSTIFVLLDMIANPGYY